MMRRIKIVMACGSSAPPHRAEECISSYQASNIKGVASFALPLTTSYIYMDAYVHMLFPSTAQPRLPLQGVTTALALQEGLSSPLFAVSFAFSSIVMYDAMGVRQHAGKQAAVLNQVCV